MIKKREKGAGFLGEKVWLLLKIKNFLEYSSRHLNEIRLPLDVSFPVKHLGPASVAPNSDTADQNAEVPI